MKQKISNVLALIYKELKSLLRDIPLVIMIIVVFTFVLASVFQQVTSEVKNATVAFVDEDHSELSRSMLDALNPPYFKKPVPIAPKEVFPAMEHGEYIFTVHFPPHFQDKMINFEDSRVQLLVDATSMTQAGIGTAYIQKLFTQALLQFYHTNQKIDWLPVEENTRIYFDENNESGRYSAVMQLVMNLTLLSLVLVGSATIREKEHGTIEHLLVMPVSVFEIALAKIISNGIVILAAAMLALYGVLHVWLKVPIHGSPFWLLICCWAYIFSATSAGMFLATLVPSMPQFGLIITPLVMITHFTSGGVSPVEAMQPWVQKLVQFLPTTHFVYNIQDLIFRGNGFQSIAFSLLVLLVYGLFFFLLALLRFRIMLQKFN
ncbi:MAG: ABC transporter permease [Neisseriaceae bacterium]